VPAKTVTLNNAGHPYIKVKVFGISDQFAREFDALIDTGFTGFLMLPLTAALPLGLTLYGTSTYTLADGDSSTNLIAVGTVEYEGQRTVGPISLENNVKCTDVLLGMDFIRQSKQVLVVGEAVGILIDMDDLIKRAEQVKAPAQTALAAESSSAPTPTKGDTPDQ
jgi:predicted aspartyl protease